MTEYTPNNWVIVKIVHPKDTVYKVLGGWSGGYLEGNSWRMNSGITQIKEDKDYYYFHGYSGSVYKCFKISETVRMNIAGTLNNLIKVAECEEDISVEQIDMKDILDEFAISDQNY